MFKKTLYYVGGWISLSLGFAGVFLPLLPTTPFVLLAAYCFSRSSKKLHRWLHEHKIFGPLIINWEQHGSISLPVKCLSTSMILVMISYPLFFKSFALWIKLSIVLTIGCTLTYIWTRPSGPRYKGGD